jgi:hypothetical protein
MGVYQGQKPPSPTTCCSPSRRVSSPCGRLGRRAWSWRQGLGEGPVPGAGRRRPEGRRHRRSRLEPEGRRRLQPVGHGLFYLAVNAKIDAGKQTADLTLARWTGDAAKAVRPGDGGRIWRRPGQNAGRAVSPGGGATEGWTLRRSSVCVKDRECHNWRLGRASKLKRRRLAASDAGPLAPAQCPASGRGMSGADRQRTRWFLRSILPHEPALRGWLSRSTPPGVDPDDVIQEAYTILAELESVDAIRHPRAYLFQVARSVIMRHVRRARIVPIHTVDDLERLELPTTRPRPSSTRSTGTNCASWPARSRPCRSRPARPSSFAASTACRSVRSRPGCEYLRIRSRPIFLAASYS